MWFIIFFSYKYPCNMSGLNKTYKLMYNKNAINK